MGRFWYEKGQNRLRQRGVESWNQIIGASAEEQRERDESKGVGLLYLYRNELEGGD